MNRFSLLGAALAASIAGGCATNGSAWTNAGYRQRVFGYEVKFRDADAKALTGPDWRLDNHYFEPGPGQWVEKVEQDYVDVRALDWDHDGSISPTERSEESIFDLKIVNRKNNGVMWTKAHPLLPEQADQELEVMLDKYLDALAGHGLYAEGNLFNVRRPESRYFTTLVVEKKLTKVGASDALTATIEVGDVDRLKQDPSARKVLKLVMVKFRCFTVANCKVRSDAGPSSGVAALTGGGPDGEPDLPRWPVVDCRGKPCHARVGLLVIGYYNAPPYFASGLPDLDDLLRRVSFPDAQPLPVSAPRIAAGTGAPPKEPDAEPEVVPAEADEVAPAGADDSTSQK